MKTYPLELRIINPAGICTAKIIQVTRQDIREMEFAAGRFPALFKSSYIGIRRFEIDMRIDEENC